MKQALFYLKRLVSKRVVAGLATVLLVAGITGSVAATFGPDRPTKAWSPTVTGFDHVTFDSFTGVPNYGDERDFLRGVQVGRDGNWMDPVSSVTQQADIEAHVYIHNGADASLNASGQGVARNVTVKVTLPTGSNRSQDVTAFISADNANPATIFDTLTMTGANNGYFELAYEAGTGQIHAQDGTTTNMTAAQEQAMIGANGVNIGDQNGCFEFVREITFRMKVNMPRYTVAKQVTTPGSTNWVESLNANPGDTVSWLVTFKNVGFTTLRSVDVVDEVPAGLTVVPGTIKLVNGNYPSGFVYPDSAIQMNGRQVHVNIGDYNGDPTGTGTGTAYVTYRTKIADASALACGLNTFTNKAFTTPQGYGAIWDTAVATTTRTCAVTPPTTPPTSLPNTGPGEVVGLFGATTAIGAVAHSLRRRR